MEIKPLPYIGKATKQQVELVRRGKELLGVDFLVRPTEAGPDTEGPAIAFEHPNYPYLYGYAFVANSDTPEKMRNALAAVYGIEYTEYLTTPAQWLSRAMVCEIEDLGWEDVL